MIISTLSRTFSEVLLLAKQEIQLFVRDRRLLLIEVGLAVFMFLVLVAVVYFADHPLGPANKVINVKIEHQNESDLLKAVTAQFERDANIHVLRESKAWYFAPETDIDVILKQGNRENEVVCLIQDSAQSGKVRASLVAALEQARLHYLKAQAESGVFPLKELLVFQFSSKAQKQSTNIEDTLYLLLFAFWMMRAIGVGNGAVMQSMNRARKTKNIEPLLAAPIFRHSIVLGKCLPAVPIGFLGGSFWIVGVTLGMVADAIYLMLKPKKLELIKGAAANVGGLHSISMSFFWAMPWLATVVLLICGAMAFLVVIRYKTERVPIFEGLFLTIGLPASVYVVLINGLDLNWGTACLPLINVYLLAKALLIDANCSAFIPLVLFQSLALLVFLFWLGVRVLRDERYAVE